MVGCITLTRHVTKVCAPDWQRSERGRMCAGSSSGHPANQEVTKFDPTDIKRDTYARRE